MTVNEEETLYALMGFIIVPVETVYGLKFNVRNFTEEENGKVWTMHYLFSCKETALEYIREKTEIYP